MRLISGFVILIFALAACTSNNTGLQFSDIPATGDAERGEELFATQINLAPACSACHIPDSPASPSLDGYGAVAGTRIEGMSAEEYTFYSIVQPDHFIVEGYGNAMYNKYGEYLSVQDIADLIAYLLTR